MKIYSVMILLAALWSCQGPSGEKAVTGEAGSAAMIVENFETYTANTESSSIEWIGARPASQHNGTAPVKEGNLKVNDGQIAGGEFVIDLQNIVVVDITDPDRNARLKGHLESDDFFDVENYPEAIFEITEVQEIENPEGEYTHTITGNLLMRGVNRSVQFDANVNVSDNLITANSEQFLINRTEWGVNYQSKSIFADLADNFILDDIALVVNLEASK